MEGYEVKKLMIIGVTILLILTSTIAIYANTGSTVTLQASETKIIAGQTFTVKVHAESPDKINGIDTTYSYDTEKLELVGKPVCDSNFASLGAEGEITLISNSTTVESADLYTLTFKVKEGVAVGSTATISLGEALLSTFAETDSEHTIPTQKITITVIEIKEEPPVGGEGEDEEDPPVKEEEKENPPVKEEEKKDPPVKEEEKKDPPVEEEKKEQEGTTVVVGNGEKDKTTANKEIPKAGLNTLLVMTLFIVAIVAIIMHRKNKKYQDIK